MVDGLPSFLISMLTRLTLREKKKGTICPSCGGRHTKLVSEIEDEEGYRRKEEYICHDCHCEWDWTHKRPFFRWRVRIRAPGWAKLE